MGCGRRYRALLLPELPSRFFQGPLPIPSQDSLRLFHVRLNELGIGKATCSAILHQCVKSEKLIPKANMLL